MERRDFHIHTNFSDGKNTPEEMVQAALAAGMSAMGFSDHSYTAFDESYCIQKAALPAYQAAVNALKEKYRTQIEIRCGIEQDYYSEEPTDGYDYVIGSVHYIKAGEHYIPVDEAPDILRRAAQEDFGGDIYALCEAYFRTAADVVRKTGADIIGHFDLISKFNERERLFDEAHPRYRAAWQAAADELLKTGAPFEINTGAISRGYKTVPYPSEEMRDYIRRNGGRFILSSDSHSASTLCYGFDQVAL